MSDYKCDFFQLFLNFDFDMSLRDIVFEKELFDNDVRVQFIFSDGLGFTFSSSYGEDFIGIEIITRDSFEYLNIEKVRKYMKVLSIISSIHFEWFIVANFITEESNNLIRRTLPKLKEKGYDESNFSQFEFFHSDIGNSIVISDSINNIVDDVDILYNGFRWEIENEQYCITIPEDYFMKVSMSTVETSHQNYCMTYFSRITFFRTTPFKSFLNSVWCRSGVEKWVRIINERL